MRFLALIMGKLSALKIGKGPAFKMGKLSRKRVYGILGVIVGSVLLYYSVIDPLIIEKKKDADEEIASKRRILQKYAEVLQNRNQVETIREGALKKSEEIQKRLLPGETAQLGAANLQDIVKKLSEKNNLSLRSFRILEPKGEADLYRKISLQIDFNPVASMASLAQFLYDIEHQDKELMISEMDLLIFNPRMPNNIQGNMVVTGLMRGTKPQTAKEAKGAKTKETKPKEKGGGK